MARHKISDEQRADPQVDAELEAEHRVEQDGGGDQDAGRQVELATDHQHADGDGDDADGRGLVEHGEERRRRPEGRRDDQEEDEDDDRRPRGRPISGRASSRLDRPSVTRFEASDGAPPPGES